MNGKNFGKKTCLTAGISSTMRRHVTGDAQIEPEDRIVKCPRWPDL